MNSRSTVLVIGNSHLKAVQDAWDAICESEGEGAFGSRYVFIQLRLEQFQPGIIKGPGGQARLNDNLLSAITAAAPNVIVSMVGGNAHNVFGLVNHPEPFDFILPESPDLPVVEDADIIPHAVMARILRQYIERYGRLLSLIWQAGVPIVCHLESPPPIPSEDHIRRHSGVFSAKIPELGVAPRYLRYKLWRLHSDLFNAMCCKLGVEFVPVPPHTRDQEGMLKAEYWSKGPTHGNKLYGAELLRTLDVFLLHNQHRWSET